MSTEDDIFEYLATPENLPVALEIADYVEQVKHNLHRKFWTTFNPRMEQKVKTSEFGSDWVFHPHPARRYRSEWGKSYIGPVTLKGDKFPQLVAAFGQSSRASDFRFFWGVKWNFEPENFDNPTMTKLKAELVARDMNIVERDWPGWGKYKFSVFDSEFMIRMYQESEELISEIVEDVWQLFTDLRPTLEEINEQFG
jgi:hypothetical protein